MKTFKFMAMLIAAFAMSFTLTACGDDDDDTPSGSKPKTNELVILNEKATITNAMFGYYGSNHIELMFRADNSNIDANKWTALMFDIHDIEPDSDGHIPTGSYKFGDRYELFNGQLNNDGRSGYEFTAIEGTSPMKVERSGNTYTITIEKLVIHYIDIATEKEGDLTTSFQYKGQMESHG